MSQREGISSKRSVVSVLNTEGAGRVLLVCEHASNTIPEELHQLGVSDEVVKSHVAWDPGAFEVAKLLSVSLDCPLIASNVSRLVYDCNRPPTAVDAMPARSEVHDIPGNQDLTDAQKRTRVETNYKPFEAAVFKTLQKRDDIVALITIHSFTPIYHGKRRKVELGILHDEDARLADIFMKLAPQFTKLVTRRNEPYSKEDGVTHTLQQHGVQNGLLNCMIEIRNDLIRAPAQRNTIASMLHNLISSALSAVQPPNISRSAGS